MTLPAPLYEVELLPDLVVVLCKSGEGYPVKTISREPISVELQLTNLRQAMADMDDNK